MRIFFTIIILVCASHAFSQTETTTPVAPVLVKAKALINAGKIEKASKILTKHYSLTNDSTTTVELANQFIEKYIPKEAIVEVKPKVKEIIKTEKPTSLNTELIKEEEKTEHPKITKAKSLIQYGKPEKAIALLNKFYSKTKDPAAAFELINLYYQSNQSKNATDWAAKVGLEKSLVKKDVLLYSRLLIQDGNYKKALDHCLNYALQKNDSEGVFEIAYACEDLISSERKSVLYNILEVPFNTNGDEVSVTNYRRNYVMSTNGLSENNHFDFYILHQEFNRWEYPYLLLRKSKDNTNRTSISYSFNGNHVYFADYEFLSEKAKKKLGNQTPIFNIYNAISTGNEWVDVKPFPFQKEGFSYKDPAIHPNEKMMVFSSNLNGKSNYDLYYSVLKDTIWTDPVNLGENVNTSADEVKPYFKADGSLYFSSNNKLGFGGFDIYQTKLSSNVWIKPDILPRPLNSKYDDMSIIFHQGQPGGFLVSNRKGGQGGYDIYGFEDFNLKMSISVVNEEDGNLLSYAEVRLVRDGILIDEKLTGKNGDVTFQIANGETYQIEIKKDGFEAFSKAVSANNKFDGEEFFVNAPLKRDANYIVATKKTPEIKFNNQNFINFIAKIVDENEEALPHNSFKMINISSGRMKIIKTDAEGQFEQSLIIGNEYKLVIEHNNMMFEKFYNTLNMKPSTKNVLFILGEGTNKSLID